MDSEPHDFSEEELKALTGLCRLAEEELADIEHERLLKLETESQARVRAVMDAPMVYPGDPRQDVPSALQKHLTEAPGDRDATIVKG